MPERVQKLPEKKFNPTMYEWGEWADGEWREFHQGTDFKVKASSFQVAGRRFCERRGWKFEAMIQRNAVFIRITKPSAAKKKLVRKVSAANRQVVKK